MVGHSSQNESLFHLKYTSRYFFSNYLVSVCNDMLQGQTRCHISSTDIRNLTSSRQFSDVFLPLSDWIVIIVLNPFP